MTTIATSRNAIIEVNYALCKILAREFEPSDENQDEKGPDIRFDLPKINSENPTPTPTISVFLYDIHEDLQLRHSERSRMNLSNNTLNPGWVNLSCNYLLTYWDANDGATEAGGPESKPDNQAVQIMTKILQALLKNRELEGIPGAYTRIIQPQENLNSLGNFWQALGNRPRLSLMCSITVPIQLKNSVLQARVKNIEAKIDELNMINTDKLTILIWKKLCEEIGHNSAESLARIKFICHPVASKEYSSSSLNINLTVTGMVENIYEEKLITIFEDWSKSNDKLLKVNNTDIYLSNKIINKLIYI